MNTTFDSDADSLAKSREAINKQKQRLSPHETFFFFNKLEVANFTILHTKVLIAHQHEVVLKSGVQRHVEKSFRDVEVTWISCCVDKS